MSALENPLIEAIAQLGQPGRGLLAADEQDFHRRLANLAQCHSGIHAGTVSLHAPIPKDAMHDVGMKLTVGTAPVELPLGVTTTPVIQNLGPGTVYFDGSNEVTTGTGIQVPLNGSYEFPRDLGLGGGTIWLVSTEAATDVRYLAVG